MDTTGILRDARNVVSALCGALGPDQALEVLRDEVTAWTRSEIRGHTLFGDELAAMAGFLDNEGLLEEYDLEFEDDSLNGIFNND